MSDLFDPLPDLMTDTATALAEVIADATAALITDPDTPVPLGPLVAAVRTALTRVPELPPLEALELGELAGAAHTVLLIADAAATDETRHTEVSDAFAAVSEAARTARDLWIHRHPTEVPA